MNQLALNQWPASLNDQVAMLSLEPAELSRRSGIKFSKSYDSLDNFRGAVCRLPDFSFALIRYDNNPVPGTIIALEEGAYESQRGQRYLLEVLTALGADRKEMSWHKPRTLDRQLEKIRTVIKKAPTARIR